MVDIKKGDLVRLEYTASVVSTGQIFETTDEEIAKKAGIFQQDAAYGPKLILFGSGNLLKGVEEAILNMEIGKEEQFVLPPEKGFGNRTSSLIRIMSASEFKKQGITPFPGMMLALDNMLAKVKSIGSGRVVVDLNHPLAGESILYKIKVLEVISDDKKKAEAILDYLGIEGQISQKESKLHISISSSTPKEKADLAKKAILSAVNSASFE
ncbi:MAG: peptidylprolyl isomerase [Candidatus Micrarchaeota archaeon]|nr:peptidylprolyl isomerase [Candidatus Micrarchaeota archaeon]